MSDKKETLSSLRRVNYRQAAIIAELQNTINSLQRVNNNLVHDYVDKKIRSEQAMKLLNGEDV